MVDFKEAGELSVFIDEEQLQALEQRMEKKGYLEARDMHTTFNMLRANDLIWSFVVNNYLLGKQPFPFDLLYWNADSTRMPAAMHSFYLRKMYQENLLVKPGGITLGGVPIDLRKIKTPSFLLSTREDHIAPWRSTYAATQLYGGPVKFMLSASGHIAGVVNPPGSKYGHCENDDQPADPGRMARRGDAGRQLVVAGNGSAGWRNTPAATCRRGSPATASSSRSRTRPVPTSRCARRIRRDRPGASGAAAIVGGDFAVGVDELRNPLELGAMLSRPRQRVGDVLPL